MNTSFASLLSRRLEAAQASSRELEPRYRAGTKVSVAGVGRPLATAFEQLRNAAEYTDEHLLLLRAVRRFYLRNLTLAATPASELGEELITELTEAGYFANGTFNEAAIAKINAGIEIYHRLYAELLGQAVTTDQAASWTFDLLAAETERVLVAATAPGAAASQDALIGTAFEYFKTLAAPPAIASLIEGRDTYETSLFIATHRALLKSNALIVRLSLFQDHSASARTITGFIELNREVDRLFAAPATERLTRFVSAQGAPWRILHGLMLERADLPQLLAKEPAFLSAYRARIGFEYERLHERLHRGLIRSLVFLVVSKVILGLSIEVPYDLYTTGAINYLPLGLNLIFPPLYMIGLNFTLRFPGRANALALEERIKAILYHPETDLHLAPSRRPRQRGVFNAVFTLLAAALFGLLGWGLARLDFNVVQGVIFFVFLSTASFLGFRLSRIVRELTVGGERGGLVGAFRDVVSLPFVVIGQWLSSTYAKVNVVAFFLDLMIELPLKSILRLIRQWISFLNDKKDEL